MDFEKYVKLEKTIAEARSLFFDKGIIKRDIIDDQIAFSWLRYKYKNVDPSHSSEGQNKKPTKAHTSFEQVYPLNWERAWIGLFNQTGTITHYYGSDEVEALMEQMRLADESYGNNGISQAVATGEWSMVLGFEHYQSVLTAYISIGIPVNEECVLGLLIPTSDYNEELLMVFNEGVSDVVAKNLQREVEPSVVSDEQELYFFSVEAPAFKALSSKLRSLKKSGPNVISLEGQKGSGKQSIARWIHKNRMHKESNFTIINAFDLKEKEQLELLEKVEEGALFIKHIRWTSQVFQTKLVEKLNFKSVYSNPAKPSIHNGLTVFLSDDLVGENDLVYRRLNPSLQEIMNICKLEIPEFTEMGIEFKAFLKREIMHICRNRYMHSISIDETFLNLLTHLNWTFQYLELIELAECYISLVQRKDPLEWQMFMASLMKKSRVNASENTLKESEKKVIQKALTDSNYNITKTSATLGITRATLYKKIKEYQLKVNV